MMEASSCGKERSSQSFVALSEDGSGRVGELKYSGGLYAEVAWASRKTKCFAVAVGSGLGGSIGGAIGGTDGLQLVCRWSKSLVEMVSPFFAVMAMRGEFVLCVRFRKQEVRRVVAKFTGPVPKRDGFALGLSS